MITQTNGNAAQTPQQSLEQIRSKVKITLEYIMGDSSPETLDDMASIFLEDGMPLINQIKEGLSNEDFTAIKMAAHALKGSSATIGLTDFADTCLAIENGSQNKNSHVVRENLALLEAQYSQIHEALVVFLI